MTNVPTNRITVYLKNEIARNLSGQEICDEISKVIDMNYLALPLSIRDLPGPGEFQTDRIVDSRPDLYHGQTGRQVCRDRGKNIATMKCS